jgi:hypothetical protein
MVFPVNETILTGMRRMILSVIFITGTLLPLCAEKTVQIPEKYHAAAIENGRLVLPNVSPFIPALLGRCVWNMKFTGMMPREINRSTLMYPAAGSGSAVPELSVGMTLLFWAIQIYASGSGPYTYEQTYDEAEKEGLVPHNGDSGGAYRFN